MEYGYVYEITNAEDGEIYYVYCIKPIGALKRPDIRSITYLGMEEHELNEQGDPVYTLH